MKNEHVRNTPNKLFLENEYKDETINKHMKSSHCHYGHVGWDGLLGAYGHVCVGRFHICIYVCICVYVYNFKLKAPGLENAWIK